MNLSTNLDFLFTNFFLPTKAFTVRLSFNLINFSFIVYYFLGATHRVSVRIWKSPDDLTRVEGKL